MSLLILTGQIGLSLFLGEELNSFCFLGTLRDPRCSSVEEKNDKGNNTLLTHPLPHCGQVQVRCLGPLGQALVPLQGSISLL